MYNYPGILAIDRDTFEQVRSQDKFRVQLNQQRATFFKRLNEQLMFLQSASYYLDAAKTKEEELVPGQWTDMHWKNIKNMLKALDEGTYNKLIDPENHEDSG
jgi:hypothetical protein